MKQTCLTKTERHQRQTTALYKVTFEFRNVLGEWMPDYLNNNGDGLTLEEAEDWARHLKISEVCATRNIKIEELQ